MRRAILSEFLLILLLSLIHHAWFIKEILMMHRTVRYQSKSSSFFEIFFYQRNKDINFSQYPQKIHWIIALKYKLKLYIHNSSFSLRFFIIILWLIHFFFIIIIFFFFLQNLIKSCLVLLAIHNFLLLELLCFFHELYN